MFDFVSCQRRYCRKGFIHKSIIKRTYVAKLLIIALLSIIIAYFLPDLTSGIIEKEMPDFPTVGLQRTSNFFDNPRILSMIFIFIFSCWISIHGIYGLSRYTLLQKHPGRKKLILVLVTYIYMIIGFANMYFLISYVGDGYDALYKFENYYRLSRNKKIQALMIKKEFHTPNYNALLGIKDKLWSGVDTKEQFQVFDSIPINELSETIPVSNIFKKVEYRQPQVIRYQHNNKPSVYANCLYFSTITIASVGYGDIIPQSDLAKFLVCLETLMGQLLLALGIASAFSEISVTRKIKAYEDKQ